jgi:hypothetical protein
MLLRAALTTVNVAAQLLITRLRVVASSLRCQPEDGPPLLLVEGDKMKLSVPQPSTAVAFFALYSGHTEAAVGKSVLQIDGRMVERLHLTQARQIVAVADALAMAGG